MQSKLEVFFVLPFKGRQLQQKKICLSAMKPSQRGATLKGKQIILLEAGSIVGGGKQIFFNPGPAESGDVLPLQTV